MLGEIERVDIISSGVSIVGPAAQTAAIRLGHLLDDAFANMPVFFFRAVGQAQIDFKDAVGGFLSLFSTGKFLNQLHAVFDGRHVILGVVGAHHARVNFLFFIRQAQIIARLRSRHLGLSLSFLTQ